ncbi:MAG: hypothetical protein KF834_09720 [Burkholderiales bacterium]|nr:hypothetical protein [Burkholderiales bacterium]
MSRIRLQRLPRLRLLHAALIALLLFVQHGALNHALLHVAVHGEAGMHAGAAPAHGHAHEDGRPSGEWSADCGFDLLYSEVLGGVPGGACPVVTGVAGTVPVAAGGAAAAESAAVPYDSRAPPAFSWTPGRQTPAPFLIS